MNRDQLKWMADNLSVEEIRVISPLLSELELVIIKDFKKKTEQKNEKF